MIFVKQPRSQGPFPSLLEKARDSSLRMRLFVMFPWQFIDTYTQYRLEKGKEEIKPKTLGFHCVYF